jgi:hypothetical protein
MATSGAPNGPLWGEFHVQEQTHLDLKAKVDLTEPADKLKFVKDSVTMAPSGTIIPSAFARRGREPTRRANARSLRCSTQHRAADSDVPTHTSRLSYQDQNQLHWIIDHLEYL